MIEKKKIALVMPYCSSKKIRRWSKKKVAKSKDFECYPPLGLMYLAASINQLENYEVKIFDANANRWYSKELKERINKECPAIVGITVTSFALNETYNIIKELTLLDPKPLIIVGGPHITKCPEAVDYLGADYGFIGDSEFSLCDFLRAYPDKTNLEKTPGLLYKRDGKIVHNSRLCDDDVATIPIPARAHIDPNRYYFSIFSGKFTLLLAARGCPFDCIYCGVPHKREYRCRKIADILEEISDIKRQGYKYINICDDIFTLKRDRTIELCNAIIKNKIDIKWGCATRADTLDSELLKLMKQAGCIDVRLGIESGSEKIRKEILNKRISDQSIIDAVRNIKKVKMIAVGFFLIGVPGETKRDIESTIRFACMLPLDYVSFNLTVPLPGSKLHEIALMEKKLHKDVWKEIALGIAQPPIYVPDGLEIKYLEKMVKKALRTFYLRPTYLISQLLQVRSIKDLWHRLTIATTIFNS